MFEFGVVCFESLERPLQLFTGTLQRITEPNTAELCTAVCLPTGAHLTEMGSNSAR